MPVPVRFPINTRKRILRASKRFGIGASEIIRQAVERQLPEWEKSGLVLVEAQSPAGKQPKNGAGDQS